jgi:hypothetical protein
MSNHPRKPRLPETAPHPPPHEPDPMRRPDERKEGGPDYGKAEKQHQNRRTTEREVEDDAKS